VEEKRKQIKNSMLYMAPMAVSSILPLISLPIFTRILTKEDYGVLALAQVYATFVSGLSNFGLIIGYERNFFQYREQNSAAQLLYSTLLFVVTVFLLFTFVTYLFRSNLSKWIIGSSNHGSLLFWAFCSAGVMSLKNYYLTYYKNTENAKAFVWYTIDESVLGIVLSLFLIVYVQVGVIGLVWGQLIASLIILSVLGFNFLKLYPMTFSWEILMDSLRISLPLTPRIFFGVIGTQFDKYMIGLLNTVGGVGIYSIGQKISLAVFNYMTAIQNVYSPQVYKRMFELGEEGGKSIGRYLTPFAYISIALGLMISLFSEEIIFVLTPKSYHGAADIIIILSMLYCSYFFGKQPQLIFAKKTYVTSLLTLVGIVLNVGINIPFIYKWGVIGAAWGTLLAGLISITVSFIISQRFYEIKWEYRRLVQIYGIFFIASLSIILMRYFAIDYLFRFITKLGFLCLYIYLGVKMNILSAESLALVRSLIRPKEATYREKN
jgi:O-antigen/teichoic acid export membrane protein